MKKWISHQIVEGNTSRQAHANLPEGSFEREIGKEGFFGPATHMYHKHMPTGWTDFEGPLQPHAFDTNKLPPHGNSPLDAAELLTNAHCRYRMWRSSGSMDHLVRNGDGDDLLFIHSGSGHFFCDYGHLEFRDGDYLMLPRGTMWRIESEGPVEMLMIEATNSSYMLPDRGLAGPHAFFDPAMLDRPTLNERFRAQQDESEWQVRIKRRNQISTVTFPFNPLDAVGWTGDLSPVRINWRDIRPLISHRYHLPPTIHATFVADRVVVCTFTPRPFESSEDALKVPFFHNNDDFDEVLFYHAGDFFSRDNIHPGMITYHPCGFTHGPHPKAMDNAFTPKKSATDEVAVMLDTRDALDVSEAARGIEWTGYVNSWKPDNK